MPSSIKLHKVIRVEDKLTTLLHKSRSHRAKRLPFGLARFVARIPYFA